MSPFQVWYWSSITFVVVPSTVLHLKLIWTVRKGVRRGEYNSLFFRLFVVQSLLDLMLFYLFIVAQFIIHVHPFGGAFLLSTNGCHLSAFIFYGTIHFFFHVQWLNAIPNYGWCLTNTLVPLGLVVREVLRGGTALILGREGHVILHVELDVLQSTTLQSTIVAVVAACVCTACYACIMRALLLHQQQLPTQDYRREKMLTLVGFSLFLCLCTFTAYFLLVTFASSNYMHLVDTARRLYIIPVVLVTFVNPWMLTITHKSLRRRLFRTANNN